MSSNPVPLTSPRPIAPPFRPATEQIALVSLVSTGVARRSRLSPDDALDFTQAVHLKFLENDYDALRRFDGRSSLRTYLTVIVGRLMVDWQRALRGRWRASAQASRIGCHAVALEELVCRDGHPVDQAVEILTAVPGAPSRTELLSTAARLDVRGPRRATAVPLTAATLSRPFVDPVASAEQERRATRLHRAVARAIERLPSGDRDLLDLRYKQGRRMSAIAAAAGKDVKRLYRRCERVLRSVRAAVLSEIGERDMAATCGDRT